MSSHLYNKQPSCVCTHTSCLPSCDRESTQGFFLRISPSPVHWLSSQELLKDIATASLSSVPYIIFFFVEVVTMNMFQLFPSLISKQINKPSLLDNRSHCSYFSAPFAGKKNPPKSLYWISTSPANIFLWIHYNHDFVPPTPQLLSSRLLINHPKIAILKDSNSVLAWLHQSAICELSLLF